MKEDIYRLTDEDILKVRLEWEADCAKAKCRGDEPLLYTRLAAARDAKRLLIDAAETDSD